MKRTLLGAAVAFAIFAFQGGIASAQDVQPAPFGLPYGAAPQYAVAPLPEGVQPVYAPPLQPVPPCGPTGICPPLIPGQAVEPPVDAGPGRAPMPVAYAAPYVAPYVVPAYPPVQQPYYAPVQPMQPVQMVQMAPTGYYYNQLGSAIPLPPLFPGQVVEPVEERPLPRVPVAVMPGQVPPVQPTAFAPAPTFAPVTPPAGAAPVAAAPVPVRVITTITPSQVKQALAERIPMAIVDVRIDLARDIDGHVPGDLHVPLGPEATFITRLAQAVPNRAVPVVFYCRDGSLAARAAALALGIGYKPYLMGAYQGW